MSGVREVGMEEVEPRSGVPSGEAEASREVRWSVRRKEQVVLRLLRGESLDLLARESGRPTGRIAGWREEFLQAGREDVEAGARARPSPTRCAGQGRRVAARGRDPARAAGEEGKPSVTEALEVSAELPAPLKTVCRVRRDLDGSPFVGEGHRKVWARLRRERGIRTSRKRVLRLTREARLLAPTPQVRKRSQRLHEGTITVEVPDTLWATDATEAWSRQEGRCAVFVIVDHASNEVWYDAARRMDRFAAADLLREVCAERFRVGRPEGRRWAGDPLRRRLLLPQRPLPGRDRPPRHRPITRLPLRTRNERGRREGAADAQGATALDRVLRDA
jgi:hypothetical protein